MIVVSDTSPLTALLTVGEADLLPSLFAEVIIPEAVHGELVHSHPSLPEWLRVGSASNLPEVVRFSEMVDSGEAEAIALAKEIHADRLLIDERKGRRLAAKEGVPVIGLVGVLLLAKHHRIIPSVRDLLQRLELEAGIYLSEQIREQAMKAAGE